MYIFIEMNIFKIKINGLNFIAAIYYNRETLSHCQSINVKSQ